MNTHTRARKDLLTAHHLRSHRKCQTAPQSSIPAHRQHAQTRTHTHTPSRTVIPTRCNRPQRSRTQHQQHHQRQRQQQRNNGNCAPHVRTKRQRAHTHTQTYARTLLIERREYVRCHENIFPPASPLGAADAPAHVTRSTRIHTRTGRPSSSIQLGSISLHRTHARMYNK